MKTIATRYAVNVAVGILCASTAMAETDGQRLFLEGTDNGATACAVCHGSDGSGNAAAGFPRVAGLDAEYLEKQLRDFQAGTRTNPMMASVASQLSDDQISAVASYAASLDAPAPDQGAVDEAALRRGQQLAERGNWDKDIPACTRCHGDDAQGVSPSMPALAGQHESYLINQLKAWQRGQRSNDPVGLMAAVAQRLSDREIEDVAAYLSTLPGPGAN